MRDGRKYKFGDVIISFVQFLDSFEVKKRPALVLFEEYGNVVCASITSNPKMKGIPLTEKEGLAFDSVIKLNYLFTISEKMVNKFLFSVGEDKRKAIREELISKIR